MKTTKTGCQPLGGAGCRTSLILVFAALAAISRSEGQGTLNITFDGPPSQPRGTQYIIQQYYEAGMSFTPIDPSAPFAGFARNTGGGLSFYPEKGTAYLQAGVGSTLMFRSLNGSAFDLLAVDLAEYSTVLPDAVTVHFVGYRHDGSVVTEDLITDGIIDGTGPLADFQTFTFDQTFRDLDRVEIPTIGWSLDNLVVSIPEPGTPAFLSLGGALACCWLGARTLRKTLLWMGVHKFVASVAEDLVQQPTICHHFP